MNRQHLQADGDKKLNLFLTRQLFLFQSFPLFLLSSPESLLQALPFFFFSFRSHFCFTSLQLQLSNGHTDITIHRNTGSVQPIPTFKCMTSWVIEHIQNRSDQSTQFSIPFQSNLLRLWHSEDHSHCTHFSF